MAHLIRIVWLIPVATGFASPVMLSGTDKDKIIFPGPIANTTVQPDLSVKIGLTSDRSEAGQLRECLDRGLFAPYFNHTSQQFDCHALLERGPCPEENQWLVLDQQDQAVCQERPCVEADQVWFSGECHPLRFKPSCPTGMELLLNVQGQGECDCIDGFLNHSGTCFQEYLQGPCPEHHQLRLVDEKVICQKHDCPDKWVLWNNGRCLESPDCGSLQVDSLTIFDTDSDGLVCSELDIRTLLSFASNCPAGKRANSNGDCLDAGESSSRPSRRVAPQNVKNLNNRIRQRT